MEIFDFENSKLNIGSCTNPIISFTQRDLISKILSEDGSNLDKETIKNILYFLKDNLDILRGITFFNENKKKVEILNPSNFLGGIGTKFKENLDCGRKEEHYIYGEILSSGSVYDITLEGDILFWILEKMKESEK